MAEGASEGFRGGNGVWSDQNLALGQREGGAEKQETGVKETYVQALPTDQVTDDGGWNEEWREELEERDTSKVLEEKETRLRQLSGKSRGLEGSMRVGSAGNDINRSRK